MRDDDGLVQGHSGRGVDKWLNFGNIIKVSKWNLLIKLNVI